jgi:anti-sigma factor RsiW
VTCTDFEALVEARIAGELDAAGAARLGAHLAACETCRTEVEETERALSLAALPPPADAERAALRGLAANALAAYAGRSRRPVRAWAVGIAAIAAAAMAVVAPAVFRRAPLSPAAHETAVVARNEAGWQEPDVDELWEVTELIDWSASNGE